MMKMTTLRLLLAALCAALLLSAAPADAREVSGRLSDALKPAAPAAAAASETATAPAPAAADEKKEDAAEEEKKDEAAAEAAPAAPAKAPAKIEQQLVLGARAVTTSGDAGRLSRELVNLKDGAGIEHYLYRRSQEATDLRFTLDRLGSWNGSYAAGFHWRDASRWLVRAKRSRADWSAASVLEPHTLRDRFTLDASWNRAELPWRPRAVFSFRGMDTRGDVLRAQGNLDRYTPKDRIPETFEPSSQDWSLALFGGRGKLDGSFRVGQRRDKFSSLKSYVADMPVSFANPLPGSIARFDGMQDILQTWRFQDNFTRDFGTGWSYAFNERYKASVRLDWAWTDNNFDLLRFQQNRVNGLTLSGNLFGLQGQQQGWLDGFTRRERYTLEGRPTDDWEFVTSLERRRARVRGDAGLRSADAAGNPVRVDASSTQNQRDEGLWDFRADYKKFKYTRPYFGFRILEREEFDNDQLASFAVNAAGALVPLPTTLAAARFLNRETRERMGFVGLRHRFATKTELDLRHEEGTYDDRHSGVVAGVNRSSLLRDRDRIRDLVTLRHRPTRDWTTHLRFERDRIDRYEINAADERDSLSLFATWAPARRKVSLGGGFTRTRSDLTLLGVRYGDEIDTVHFNGGYRFDDRLSASLDLSRTLTGDATRLDYKTGDLAFRYALRKDRDLTFGYSDQRYKNKDFGGEDFRNRVFLFTYGIKR